MLSALFISIFGPALVLGQCDPGWSQFNGHCYKHIIPNHRVVYSQASSQCAENNAWVTSVESPEERDFVVELSIRPGSWDSRVDAMTSFSADETLRSPSPPWNYPDYLLVGGTRGSFSFTWNRSNSTWMNWCPGEPTNVQAPKKEDCAIMQLNNPCVYDAYCDGDWSASNPDFKAVGYKHFTCKKCTTDSDFVSGECRCRSGYIVNTESQVGRRGENRQSQRCILRKPCAGISNRPFLSIIFIVDSSASIGTANWKYMVEFLQTGAEALDNSVRVGFVKFSTNVTYSKWLPNRWMTADFIRVSPFKYDDGYTNTPAALEAAAEMFKSDRSNSQMAVLITDGMPYVEGELPQEEAMPRTLEAVNKLKANGAELVALGYGKELRKMSSYLKQLLENPREDYFDFKKEACDLRAEHMSILLNKVCSRYR